MAVLGELTELLRRWEVWRRVDAAPDRIDALEKRIAELEQRLQRAPGEACPKCGKLDFRVDKTFSHSEFGDMGVRVREMKCGACGFTDEKTVYPG
jgi:ribosomal protein L37E